MRVCTEAASSKKRGNCLLYRCEKETAENREYRPDAGGGAVGISLVQLSPKWRKEGCLRHIEEGAGVGVFLPENSPRVTTGKVFKIK